MLQLVKLLSHIASAPLTLRMNANSAFIIPGILHIFSHIYVKINSQQISSIHKDCSTVSITRMYIESGSCAIPLSPFIAPSKCDVVEFSKTPNTACGSVGVLTYDLLEEDTDQPTEKIAVMFSVPYDFNMYSNWYAVGIFEKSKECDHDLFNDMYYNTSPSFVRGKANSPALIQEGDRVKVMATMSDSYQPVMKVQVMNCVTKM